jgi:hypothetical protein
MAFSMWDISGCDCSCGTVIRPCTACTLPTVLHVTDSFTTVTCNYDATIPGWVGCYNLPVSLLADKCDHCLGQAPAPAAGSTTIVYKILGTTGVNGACNMSLIRQWGVNPCYCHVYFNGNYNLTTCKPTVVACPDGLNTGGTPSNTDTPPGLFNGCNMPLSLTLNLSHFDCAGGGTTDSPLGAGVVIDL